MAAMTKRRWVPTIPAAVTAALLLAACGGGGSEKDPSTGQPDDAKRLAFTQCMRKAGLNITDQTSSGGRRDTRIEAPKGISPARLQTIQRDCARKTGGGPREPSKAEQAKFLDQALKFSRCMRAHGVDLPDPKAQGGGIVLQQRSAGGGGEIDPRSPAFQRAQKQCESFMPKGKGAGIQSKSGGGPDKGKPSLSGSTG
ncbi:MAG: hypothetical protein QOH43_3351 [Solirubrobacteraceae bacterium]|nr:hypothetical protein [Solirubrobacteraceae bacterium]